MRNFFQPLQHAPNPASLPRLTISQHVVDTIVANALIYETETGESLVGFTVNQPDRIEPDLYVIDTIAPDDSAIRRGAYFEQGDDRQGDIFNWWYDNWQHYRKLTPYNGGGKWDVPLTHLGDWHKHPGTLVEPSWGDADTAREVVHDRDGTAQLLVILATVWDQYSVLEEGDLEPVEPHEVTELFGPLVAPAAPHRLDENPDETLRIPIGNSATVRIDFWYMSRNVKRFARLKPTVVPEASLPGMPPVSWHLLHQDRVANELEALRKAGYAVSLRQFDTDDKPPLEICLSLARRDSQHVLIVVTPPDYPKHQPILRMTPMSLVRDIPENADLFARLWAVSQPVPDSALKAATWHPDMLIADLARAVETRLAGS